MSNECEKCGREKEFTGTVLMSMPSINVMKCRACEPFEFSGSAVAGRTYRSGPHIGGGISDESEKVEWDGVGLPPVGCECEFFDCDKWFKVTMMYGGSQLVVLYDHNNQIERSFSTSRIDGKFRPIRSEAERKREEAINKIQSHCHVDHRAPISDGQAIALYDAIAAGKIPGIRIE